jgi:hypothetical protein
VGIAAHYPFRNSSGNFAEFTAIRRASSFVSILAAASFEENSTG